MVVTNKKKYEQLFSKAAEAVFAFTGQPEGLEAGVLFVSDAKMRELNRHSRGADAVTDVLSFPMLSLKAGEAVKKEEHVSDTDGETGLLYIGDIVLSEKKIRAQAAEYGNTYEEELRYLTVHGLLHLLGFDHETEADKEVMREAEKAVIALFKL